MSSHQLRTQLRIGLTGGIGSGKSTVANAMQALGAYVVDADVVSQATTQSNGSAMPTIQRVFGSKFVKSDGALARDVMREHIFKDPKARMELEAIIHPLVRMEIDRLSASSSAPCIVFDVPLLVESSRWREQLDWVWVVDCSESTQVSRVQQRNAWPAAMVQAVIGSQSSRSKRISGADAVIYNERLSIVELRAAVGKLAIKFGL